MPVVKQPPKAFERFVRRFPELGEAWALASSAGREGPLDERTRLIVKLAIAVGATRESAVHSAVRKARAAGVDLAAMEQVAALGASTLGFPSSVAAFTWIHDEAGPKRKRTSR